MQAGLTPLQVAGARGDGALAMALIEAKADHAAGEGAAAEARAEAARERCLAH